MNVPQSEDHPIKDIKDSLPNKLSRAEMSFVEGFNLKFAINCDICLRTFAACSTLNLHKDTHHKEDTKFENDMFEIDNEIKELVTEIEILELEIEISKLLKCKRSKNYNGTVSYYNKPIYCEICLKTFSARSTLTLHRDIEHEIIEEIVMKN